MKLNFKAALLSAFVLPGLGQLYLGRKVKGGIIVFLVNIFLLGAFALVFREVGRSVLLAKAEGKTGVAELLAGIQSGSPASRWMLAFFCALWVYSATDALFDRGSEK